MQKTGILVVSFGTSYQDSLANNIQAIEKSIGKAFPDCELRRAFTSGMIIRKLQKRDGFHVDTVEEALESFVMDGFSDLIVQPTHIINGIENDIMLDTVRSYLDKFHSVRVGTPLLTTTDDYRALIDGVMCEFSSLKDDEFLVFMGHGTEHDANAVYPALDYMLKADGHTNVYIGTVEGYPDLPLVKELVREKAPKRIILAPLMIVAGDHATNDMAGEEKSSWKNEFQREGYEVDCILKGLGEYPAVRNIFVEHAKEAVLL
ncbi:sirohydrochlorin cobaltochelatase [Qiania dongpingensis]|uniref:Sirohydrochlorin cobaltochelatase n=1 Tax=Qiania dongpingensis TaxID=2763669 RepID=A0A7G9G4D6_9FIRM|nr:sirohydrochlorin cobaltochelatase [Qiania dongpingensis]QNM05668.1 sirohydrochlorin cobaltochelatase [Qiania dongpingensis]